MMKAALTFIVLVASVTGCNYVKGAPSVDVSLDLVSQYNLRGAVQVDKLVAQPAANIRVPLSESTGIGAGFWANINSSDDAGDAVLPDGDGQSFSEIDSSVTYYQAAGQVEYSIGAINYAYPSNRVVTPDQTDVFATAAWDSGGWGNTLTAYYSLNDFGGLYLRADFSRGWVVNNRTNFNLGLGIAYSDEENALYYYGSEASGLADVSVTGALSYAFDKRTSGSFYVTAIQFVDDKFEAGLSARNIETENVFFGVSMAWSY